MWVSGQVVQLLSNLLSGLNKRYFAGACLQAYVRTGSDRGNECSRSRPGSAACSPSVALDINGSDISDGPVSGNLAHDARVRWVVVRVGVWQVSSWNNILIKLYRMRETVGRTELGRRGRNGKLLHITVCQHRGCNRKQDERDREHLEIPL